MFSNISSWFYGSAPAEKTAEVSEPRPDALIEVDENFEPIDVDESDDWVILGKGDSEVEVKKTDDEGMTAEKHSRSSSSCQNEEGWFVTPPPCFTSVGPADMETTPLENLLIEHPSMSVYHSPTVSSVLPERRTLASISSNNESFDDDTPIVFETVKSRNRLPRQQKKKTLKKSVPLDEFKVAPEKFLGNVPAVNTPIIVEAKKLNRSSVEMFPVLSAVSKPKVASQKVVRSYKEVAASLKRRQPKNEILQTNKHVKVEPETISVNKPKVLTSTEKIVTPVQQVVTAPKVVLKKGRQPPNPLPHLVKDESKKIPKENVPKMRAQERLVRLSSFSVIQTSDLQSNEKPSKKNVKCVDEELDVTNNEDVKSSVPVPPKPVVVGCEEKKKRKVQKKIVVKQAKNDKVEESTTSQAVAACNSQPAAAARPKCEVTEKRDQKSPVKKENIIIPLTTSIALNSLVSRPEENAYKHELLKRELAMIAGTTKAQKLQAHRETRILCRNQLTHINRVNFMLSASNKRLRRADKNMRPSGANNNRKCC